MTVEKTMTISQVLALHRGTARILMSFGMHCLGCPGASAESLEQACRVHGSNVEELVDQLNAFLVESQGES
jgi:hybrid cluster-associated redox disulfide protein